MSQAEPISSWFTAESVTPAGDLDPAFVHVDPELAAALATSHTRTFEVAAVATFCGDEQFSAAIPNAKPELLECLDEQGLVRVGTHVQPGSILVGKLAPREGGEASAEEKLLLAIFGEKASEMRDTSLRCPPGCAGTVTAARMVPTRAKTERARAEIEISWARPLVVGDELLLDATRGVVSVRVAAIESLGGARRLAWAGNSGSLRVAKRAMVEELIHARSIGPYTPDTQQPTAGREQFGGQALSAPQLAALADVAPWAAWEMCTIKSDAVAARVRAYEALVRRSEIELPGSTASAPTPTAPPQGNDVFSLFERPARSDVRPGDVAAELPECVELLVRQLLALGIELRPTASSLCPRLLTSEQLLARSHGEVQNPETLNYRTHRPERGGLFCARVFGPTEDYACLCGKYKRMKHRGVVCEKCGVEVISARVRRERFGHVKLAEPVVHPLFMDTVAQALQITTAQLDEVLRGQAGFDADDRVQTVDASEQDNLETGGRALLRVLEGLGPARLGELEPAQLMISVLPVLPPDLRPLEPLDDLNDLYRRVVNRNNRLARLLELDAPKIILRNEFGHLQRAVTELFDNEHTANPVRGPKRQVLRSLGRMVEASFAGLATRTVDFSGVTHVVVDPELARGRCRLPARMARELFRPMAYGRLEAEGFTATIRSAKQAVDDELDDALAAIATAATEGPVLLINEAAIVAREVELWDEAAIAVDPSTARSFVGNEVSVHVPLGSHARDEIANLRNIVGVAALESRAARDWFGAAVFEDQGLARVVEAARTQQEASVEHPLLRAALGRGPSDTPAPPTSRPSAYASTHASTVEDEDEDDF